MWDEGKTVQTVCYTKAKRFKYSPENQVLPHLDFKSTYIEDLFFSFTPLTYLSEVIEGSLNKTQRIEILDHEDNMIAKWLESDRIRIQSNSKMIGNQYDSKMIGNPNWIQNDWISKWLVSKIIGLQN